MIQKFWGISKDSLGFPGIFKKDSFELVAKN